MRAPKTSFVLFIALALGAALGAGCGERVNPDFCATDVPCAGGRVCNLNLSQCEAVADGAAATNDAVAAADSAADPDVPADSPEIATDGPGDVDGDVDGNPTADGAADRPSLDAPGSCTIEGDCQKSDAGAHCVMGLCAACARDDQCPPTTPVCRGRQCLACGAAGGDAACANVNATLPACDAQTGRCVQCLTSAGCAVPTAPLCAANVCVGCKAGPADGCLKRAAGTPACDATTGRCAECAVSGDCQNPRTPICVANKCLGCAAVEVQASACQARSAAAPVCDRTSGACVECIGSADCPTADRPVCVANRCAPCTDRTAPADACTRKNAAAPLCNPGTGQCVICLAHADCRSATRPVCNQNECVSCAKAPTAACAQKGQAAPVCDTNSGACVQCVTDGHCTEPGKPLCASGQCGACSGGPVDACQKKSQSLPVCEPKTGACVACTTSAQCEDPARPVCLQNLCDSCEAAPNPHNTCALMSPNRPLCDDATGGCVQCLSSAGCPDAAAPICVKGQCVPCPSHAACAAANPATPVCDGAKCVECFTGEGCTIPDRPLCMAGRCVRCDEPGAAADACVNRGAGAGTACDAATGRCEECLTSANCKETTKPICIVRACVPCNANGVSVDACQQLAAFLSCNSLGQCAP